MPDELVLTTTEPQQLRGLGRLAATFENSRADYIRFAKQTVDVFVAGNGRLPSMDFVMTYLRHTTALLGHRVSDPGIFLAVASYLRQRFPALDPPQIVALAEPPAAVS